MTSKRLLAGLVLLLAPLCAVFLFRLSAWGPAAATPRARQTGEPRAPITIIEYSDFQCPSCARIQPTVHQFMELYKGKIRLLFKHYPLTNIHKNAIPAAHAAECAAAQDKFWPYHDRLFQTQASWAPLSDPTTSFTAIAQDVQLDMGRFQICVADPQRRAPIEQDMQEAKARGVNATPTFFIGEERLVGNVFATDGARTIERELRR